MTLISWSGAMLTRSIRPGTPENWGIWAITVSKSTPHSNTVATAAKRLARLY